MRKPICFPTFALLLLGGIALYSTGATAIEPICPGGAAPDPRVIWCDDFEDGTSKDSWGFDGYPPENGEAVRCDNDSFGFHDRCAAYSGVLHFDGYWGYGNHYGERYLPDKASMHRELYLRMYVYFPDPYVWGNTGDKGIYFRGYDANGADVIPNIKVAYSDPAKGHPGAPVLGGQACDSYSYNSTCPQNQNNDIAFQPGRWYRVGFYVKLNDPGIANGVAKIWIDDADLPASSPTLRLSYDNLQIRAAGSDPALGYNAVFLTLYNQRCDLGAACPGVLNQWMKWDNILVATEPVDVTACTSDAGCDTLAPAAPSNLTVQ